MARHSVSITAWPSLELWNSPSLTSSINRSVALDLAKNVFEIDGVDNNGRVLVRRQIRRSRLDDNVASSRQWESDSAEAAAFWKERVETLPGEQRRDVESFLPSLNDESHEPGAN
jgi:hypothetical protein